MYGDRKARWEAYFVKAEEEEKRRVQRLYEWVMFRREQEMVKEKMWRFYQVEWWTGKCHTTTTTTTTTTHPPLRQIISTKGVKDPSSPAPLSVLFSFYLDHSTTIHHHYHLPISLSLSVIFQHKPEDFQWEAFYSQKDKSRRRRHQQRHDYSNDYQSSYGFRSLFSKVMVVIGGSSSSSSSSSPNSSSSSSSGGCV